MVMHQSTPHDYSVRRAVCMLLDPAPTAWEKVHTARVCMCKKVAGPMDWSMSSWVKSLQCKNTTTLPEQYCLKWDYPSLLSRCGVTYLKWTEGLHQQPTTYLLQELDNICRANIDFSCMNGHPSLSSTECRSTDTDCCSVALNST